MKTRILLALVILAALTIIPDTSVRAHGGIIVDGAYGSGEWLGGFGSNGCPAFPGDNSWDVMTSYEGCTGPAGEEWIWKDALGDNRADNGNLQDLNTFRLTADSTTLYGLAEFYAGDGFDCDRMVVMVAVDTDSGTGGNDTLPAYSSDTDTDVDFGSGDGWERVIEFSTARQGVWDTGYGWSGTGVNTYCNETNRMWEFSVAWSSLGVTLPDPDNSFIVTVFGRTASDTIGAVDDIYGPNAKDLITDGDYTWPDEIQDNAPDSCPAEAQSGDDCANDYKFTINFGPTAVDLIELNASVRPSLGPAAALAGVALLGLGVFAWRVRRRGR